MRQVTSDVVGAFMRHERRKSGNTHTDGQALYLHGNRIAEHCAEGIEVSSAGWQTLTTKERLNGIPGVHVVQRAGEWYLNGEPWNGTRKLVARV